MLSDTMTRSTGAWCPGGNGGNNCRICALVTGGARSVAGFRTRNLGGMTIRAGEIAKRSRDVMRRGRLMLGSTMAISTGAWCLGGNRGNNCRHDTLVTGGAGGVAGLGICDLCGVTIGTSQPSR